MHLFILQSRSFLPPFDNVLLFLRILLQHRLASLVLSGVGKEHLLWGFYSHPSSTSVFIVGFHTWIHQTTDNQRIKPRIHTLIRFSSIAS